MKPSTVTVLLAAALAVCWSSGFVGATWSTSVASVDTVLFWRTAIAAAVLGAVMVLRGERIAAGELPRLVRAGVLVQVVYLGGTFAAAAAGVPAGTSALIAAMQPLLVVALSTAVLHTAATGRQLFGLAVGAVGVGVVVAGDLGGAAWWAFLLPVLAVAGLATGTVLESGIRSSLLAALTVQCTTAAIVFGAVAGVRGRLAPPAESQFWPAIAWLVGLAALGGYGTFLAVVRRSGPTVASALLYLTPPTTALWAWAMFGQRPGPLAVPGVVLTAIGIAVFATRRRVSVAPAPAPRSRPRSAAARGSRGRPRAVRPTPRPASRT